MSKFTIKKATRTQKPARIAILGQTGAGKTLSSLLLAQGLTNSGKVLVVDTENGRASLKAGNPFLNGWDFDVVELEPDKAHPTEVTTIAAEAVKQGYDAIVYDSSSHLWEWTLNKKEQLGEAWRYWALAKAPYYEWLRKGVITLPIHTILTLRTDMKYEQEESGGKKKVVKLGLQPQGEKNLQYEMDFVFSVRREDHRAEVEKTEDGVLPNDDLISLNLDTGLLIRNWLLSGKDYDPNLATKASYVNRIIELYTEVHEVENLPEEETLRLSTLTLEELRQYGLELKDQISAK